MLHQYHHRKEEAASFPYQFGVKFNKMTSRLVKSVIKKESQVLMGSKQVQTF